MKTPVAVHPLPQGGEGYNLKSARPSVATFRKSFGGVAFHFFLLPFLCGSAALRYIFSCVFSGLQVRTCFPSTWLSRSASKTLSSDW